MQKLINAPEHFVDEMLDGMVRAHPNRVRLMEEEGRALVRADTGQADRVAIVTGGGSGHLPLFAGYVVMGLADGCAVGDLFASPSADQILWTTRGAHRGNGVLFLYGNYQGDVLNFDLAADMAREEGIETSSVRGADDVSSAPPERANQRRGVAGIYFGYVVAAATAASGASLAEVASATRSTLERTRSVGVALAPCTLPTVGHPNFTIDAGAMEIGMGIHGEPGVHRGELRPADEVVDTMMAAILEDRPIDPGSEIAILVNGLGATPREELYIMFRRVEQVASAAGLRIGYAELGQFATSLEMAGASISVVEVDDDLAAGMEWHASRPIGDIR